MRSEQAMRAASSKAVAVAGALSRAEQAQRDALAEVGEQLTKVLEQQEQEVRVLMCGGGGRQGRAGRACAGLVVASARPNTPHTHNNN